MVKIMENPIKMDDLGGKPTILGNIHIVPYSFPTFLLRFRWFGVVFGAVFWGSKYLQPQGV